MLLRKARNSEPGQPALTAVRLSVLGAREQRKNFTYLKYLPCFEFVRMLLKARLFSNLTLQSIG
jgi:hypothetical protein